MRAPAVYSRAYYYTQRLEFHIERVQRHEPLYIPDPKVAVSMIHSEDLAGFLLWAIGQKLTGDINVASPRSITMAQLLAQIQLVTGEAPVLSKKADEEILSPYALPQTLSLNVERMRTAGFQTRPILDWLPALIGTPEASAPRGMLH